jgi:membrane protein implicated in regulation of membrane protease activity
MLNAQNAAAFIVAFGACGYLLTRFTALGGAAVVALAVLAGVLVAIGSASLLAAWVIPGARSEAVDERYLLQGHPARVTRPIDASGGGEIVYEVDGRRFTVAARSWDGAPIDVGTDVAIERVEGGVAYVERWAQVEARL